MSRPPRDPKEPHDPKRPARPKPEPVAVALDYRPEISEAPRVVASGRGFVAEKILELAFAHGVKVREDADLAQILAAVDIDSEIPIEAYVAVAEILSYVYRANNQMPPEADPEAHR
ncbi:MAG: EscU/YscU/HrcU family type III secretion system export apparatus switch protein [Rhodospirillales bacterium]|nr:EscU/YscU/HrcU family type III secretion system export apparatus switch protein [Rhodospirillales bacterium]